MLIFCTEVTIQLPVGDCFRYVENARPVNASSGVSACIVRTNVMAKRNVKNQLISTKD